MGPSNLETNRNQDDRNWFVVFALPKNEKAIVKQLEVRTIETFLPTFESTRIWKNRQRKKIVLPLFPCYLFVRIGRQERAKVLQCPGVVDIVGNGKEHIPLPDFEVELLRTACHHRKVEPYQELVTGEKVRVRRGVMQGLEGTLVRKGQGLRFVLTLELVNQHAAIEVDAADLEPVVARCVPAQKNGTS